MTRVISLFSLTFLLFFTGCSDTNAVGSSLNLGETTGMDCVPGENGASRMFGDTFLIHEGDEEITITDISLVNADGLELKESVLVKLNSDEALLGFGEWPPTDSTDFPLPKNWDNRVEAIGAKVQPNEMRNLVFALTSTSSETGSTDAVKIEYKDSTGKTFEQETLIRYFITSDECEDV
ncbi:hypothetical protein [Oceanobacillus manasiensis]|uniref:hypothetical protein n=1 Tax=Oceanobacillus manasiensis TaxID=586413 RepID=UPI0005A8784B|nr:hypothetical protein [Oceanobacillus manasiensis]